MPVTQNREAEELVETFAMFEDWEDRYRFIIDMGKQLEPVASEHKTESYRVHGCQSTVHLVPRVEASDPPRVEFVAESDAAIVNGLIAILKRIYDGRTVEEILAFDVGDFFQRLELNEHLSPTRRNGLYEMVKRIRQVAEGAG